MATKLQELGKHGERIVIRYCACPRCKRSKTLKKLVTNFKCADIICDFCGFIAQVKTSRVSDINKLPSKLPAGNWLSQKERMDAGIYISLYIVLVKRDDWMKFTISYLASELQSSEMFIPRKPLSERAKRAGWQGFVYKFEDRDKLLVSRVYPKK